MMQKLESAHSSGGSSSLPNVPGGEQIIEVQYKWGVGFIQVRDIFSDYVFHLEERDPDEDKNLS